jgi:hypothetical protein
MEKYLKIPYTYIDKEGNERKVCFFLPYSWIKTGSMENCRLLQDNFLGVNIKMILESIE